MHARACSSCCQLRRIANATGIYKGGVFDFTFAINQNYPHEAPKVRCTQKVSRLARARVCAACGSY